MDIFQFFWGALAWTAAVAAFWPVNVAMAALAFRIWRETRESDVEGSELWIRSALASFTTAVAAIAFVLLDWVLADLAEFPAGIVHMAVFVGFLAIACWIMFYMFNLEDFFAGMSLAVIYLFLPAIGLFLLNGLLGLISPYLRFCDPVVGLVYAWLKAPPSS